MRLIKGVLLGLCVFLFSLSLTGMLISAVFGASLGKPRNIKSWLQESNIYEAGINNLLNEAKTAPDSSTLSQPEVQNVITQTLTPEVVRSSIEQIIDGTYHWLEGKADKPDFRVDLTSLKANLAENAGNAVVERLNRLPACTKAQMREINAESDPFAIPCRPIGIDVAAQKQKIVGEILNNQDILADPIITADTLKSEGEQPFYEKAQQLPGIYQGLQKAPWIFGLLSLLLATAIVWLSSSHRKGLHKLAISLISTGALLALSALLINWFTDKLTSNKNLFKPDVSADLQSAAIALGKSASNSVNNVLWAFGIAFIVLGIGALVYLRLSRPKATSTPEKPPKDEQEDTPTDKSPSHPTRNGLK